MTRSNIAFFTPSMNDPALLEAIFTARDRLAEQMMSSIRDSVESGSRHYMLLLGPRGIGKTHLVSLIYYRVKQDESIHAKLRIAWLQEDPYAVSSYARLLRAILSQLDLDYKLPGWVGRLSEIENLDDSNQIERALEHAMIEYLGNRVLLLIAENLDEIFVGLGDDGQKKLRAFLQTKGFVTILATSTSLLPALDERDQPFFGFFRKYPLSQFTFQDCVNVLVKIAEFRKDYALAETLNSPQGRARIHAIHHLAGGNPRIYVIFYQFLSRESLDQLIDPFMKLVEELMPYYQARMQTLSPQQRTLIDIIRRNESPIAVRDIAKAAFISSQSASRDLKTLRDLGYVESSQVGRESLYELREPLMRICLSAKEQRGQALPLFIQFLRIWFTPTELEGMSNTLSNHMRDYEMYREAIEASRRAHSAMIEFQRLKILEHLRVGENDMALALLLSLTERVPGDLWGWYTLKELLIKQKQIDKLIDLALIRTQLFPTDGAAWNDLNYSNYLAGKYEAALQASTQAVALSPDEPIFWISHIADLQRLERRAALFDASAKALGIRENSGNYKFWYLRGLCLTNLNRWDEAADAYLKSLVLHESDYNVWRSLHVLLDMTNANPSRAKVAEFAVGLFPTNPLSWRDYAIALVKIGQYKEALAAHETAIKIAPNEDYLQGERFPYLVMLNDIDGARILLKHFESGRKSSDKPTSLAWLTLFWAAAGDRHKTVEALVAYVNALRAKGALDQLSSLASIVNHSKDPASWIPTINLFIEVLEEQGELPALGAALVRGLMRNPAVLTLKTARDWTEAWQNTAGDKADLRIPFRLMDVGLRFIETEDRTVLLELPVEQRALLEPEIDRFLRVSGKLRTDVDRKIDELIENIERKREAQPANPMIVGPEPKVDEARLDRLLISYDAERSLPMRLQSLLSGEWSSVPKESARQLLRVLANSRAAAAELSRPGLSILKLDQLHLNFMKGFLYQAHIELDGWIGAIDFWSDGALAVLLDGKSGPIYVLVNNNLIDSAGENELAYIVFFCCVLRGEEGRFQIVGPADTVVMEAVKVKNAELSLMGPTPTEVDGRRTYETHVVYADHLIRAVLRIDHDRPGYVEMVEDAPLLNNLGLRQERFDGAIRLWATEGAPGDAEDVG